MRRIITALLAIVVACGLSFAIIAPANAGGTGATGGCTPAQDTDSNLGGVYYKVGAGFVEVDTYRLTNSPDGYIMPMPTDALTVTVKKRHNGATVVKFTFNTAVGATGICGGLDYWYGTSGHRFVQATFKGGVATFKVPAAVKGVPVDSVYAAVSGLDPRFPVPCWDVPCVQSAQPRTLAA